MNGLIFDVDNIMVKDSPQVITGLKSVRADPVHPVVFKGIKLKGSLNQVDVNDLVNNQVRLFLNKIIFLNKKKNKQISHVRILNALLLVTSYICNPTDVRICSRVTRWIGTLATISTDKTGNAKMFRPNASNPSHYRTSSITLEYFL